MLRQILATEMVGLDTVIDFFCPMVDGCWTIASINPASSSSVFDACSSCFFFHPQSPLVFIFHRRGRRLLVLKVLLSWVNFTNPIKFCLVLLYIPSVNRPGFFLTRPGCSVVYYIYIYFFHGWVLFSEFWAVLWPRGPVRWLCSYGRYLSPPVELVVKWIQLFYPFLG